MRFLHNTISNKLLKEAVKRDNIPRTTISFYKYFNIVDPVKFRNELYKIFFNIKVLGRVYISYEGVNAQINVPTHNFELFKEALYNFDPQLKNIRLNCAIEESTNAFWVLRMKVRDKIVADGITDKTFDINKTGIHLSAAEVNKMIEETSTIIVDMRNHYEYEVGHFQNALEIPSDTFKEQLPMSVEMLKNEKNKNILMYCTGGIRCEKASAYLLHNGFKNVYQIDGGIIEYTRKAKEQNLPIKFIGKNFVFDQRMGERITEDIISTCHQCSTPCDTHINCENDCCHLLFIQCHSCSIKYNNCCSENCKQLSLLPIEERKALRKGKKTPKNFFNKRKINSI